jgi:ParB-like chromosome segregation protein Spo0J
MNGVNPTMPTPNNESLTAQQPGYHTQRVLKDKGRKAVQKKAKALQRLEVTYVPLGSVHPNTYNPNRQSEHDFELLLRSMEEDGFTQPLVCLPDGTIVDGEHRWRAAQQLGLAEIPVVKVDMTPEQMRIATLRHNRARGSEDLDLSAQVLKDLQTLGALDWAQDSLLLSDAEMNRMLEEVPAPEALAAEEYSPAWEPDRLGAADRAVMTEGTTEARVVKQASEGVHMTALSPAAIEASRQREAALNAARTREEREMAAEIGALYRLSLVFAGAEATLVQQVLGQHPAERLVTLCREVSAHAATADATPRPAS